jgi:hypothetical protein
MLNRFSSPKNTTSRYFGAGFKVLFVLCLLGISLYVSVTAFSSFVRVFTDLTVTCQEADLGTDVQAPICQPKQGEMNE